MMRNLFCFVLLPVCAIYVHMIIVMMMLVESNLIIKRLGNNNNNMSSEAHTQDGFSLFCIYNKSLSIIFHQLLLTTHTALLLNTVKKKS